MRAFKRRIGRRWAVRPLQWLLLGVVISALHAVPALAAGQETKIRQAREACLSGDYLKGVSILSRLFVISKDPVHIYNQGRCFEQNRRYEDAISRFQEFVRVLKTQNPEAQEDANKHIEECRAMLGQTSPLLSPPSAPPAAPAVAAQAPPAAPVESTTPPPAPASVPVVSQPATESAHDSGAGFRIAGVITTAVGGAALVTGLLLNLKTNSMSAELEEKDKYSASRDSTRKTYKTMSAVSYGVGAACVATGVVLYLMGRRGQDDSTTVALLPAFASGQASAVIEGRF